MCARQPLRLGPAFAAAIASLSHLARVGLATHVTSPWVMPGWDGHLTLELLNTGPARLRLHRDMPVARAVIWRMDGPPALRSRTPTTAPEHLGSRYAAEFGSPAHREQHGGLIAMDCAFCTEFAALPRRAQETRIICEVYGWVLLPTVGCFTPGYCLFMPLAHRRGRRRAARRTDSRVGEAVEDMRALISSVFGPVIIAEHGPRGCELGASCCSHAHLHLIPVPDVDAVTAAYRATGGPAAVWTDLAGLPASVDGPYLYLSPRPGEHLLWPSAGFARQYVRRVCAAQHGVATASTGAITPSTATRRSPSPRSAPTIRARAA